VAQATGYVPVTKAAYETAKAEGYYKTNPTREIADPADAWHPI
jgi:sn-glycerol 3-phosphate transport system substrate-binding protein